MSSFVMQIAQDDGGPLAHCLKYFKIIKQRSKKAMKGVRYLKDFERIYSKFSQPMIYI